ncbi:PAS domain S-box protein [uncultured Reyranella sp.]|uniref:PAS domain S-box protein n=1 Tax=uncultured Reyranella sp. TaxID=735512 RepID=UPI0025CC9D6D|nr:PAS domain S-box protein [uncultured Reyranella sp.]
MKQQQLPRSGTEPKARSARWIFCISLAALAGLLLLAAALTVEHWLDLVPSFQRAMQDLFSRGALMAMGLVIALIAFGFLFQRSLAKSVRQGPPAEAALKAGDRLLLIVFAAFVLGIAGTGYLLNNDLRTAFRDERMSQQVGIARLKAQQIDQWVAERAIDLGFLVTSLKGLPLEQIQQTPELRQIVELVLYQVLIGNPERREIMLFSADGQLLAEAGGAPGHKDHDRVEDLVRDAARDGKLKIGPPVLDSDTPPSPSMAFAQPFDVGTTPPRKFVVVLMVDPAVDLFRKIQAWPTDSARSEILLVRQDGDEAVYLIPPRFWDRPIPPEGVRLPLSTPNLMATAAIRDGDGTREGLDYWGKRVIAASRSATAVPWIVIAKSDEEEVMAPVDRRSQKIALVFGATILVAGFLVWSLWKRQREEAHDLAVRNLRFVHAVQDMFIVIDSKDRILETNEAAQKAVGYGAEELRGKDARILRAPDRTDEDDRRAMVEDTAGRQVAFRTVVRRKDGSTFPAEVRISTFELEGQTYRQAMGVDISDRVRLEQDVLRLARVKRSLQAATSILLRARSEAEIFDQICAALVEFGDYRMVAVAVPSDDPAERIRFPSVAGHDDGFLAQVKIVLKAQPVDSGPPLMAIKTGAVQVNQDFDSNPATLLMREEALRRGYRSSIALPLRRRDAVVAALSIYAAQPQAFDAEEVQLLSALADDISYALCRLASPPAAKD